MSYFPLFDKRLEEHVRSLIIALRAGREDTAEFMAVQVLEHATQAGIANGATALDVLAAGRKHVAANALVAGEITLSQIFTRRLSKEFRYTPEWDKWLAWDGTRWQVDNTGAARLAMKSICDETARAVRSNHAHGVTEVARLRASRYYESSKTVTAALQLANCEPVFVCPASRLDADDHLLNTPAGTIDLRTGAMRPHGQADFITKVTAAAPDGSAHPVFDKFLRDVTCGDNDLADYLQVSLGSCASGAITDHFLMFWHGDGRNGKNTLGDLVAYLMGDYAKTVPTQTLMSDRHGNRHPTEIANLRGLRLAISSEVNEGEYWNEARLKELTGDATLSARFMRQDLFEFRRTHKHLVYGNHRPMLRVVDRAMAERLHLVPFKAVFTDELGNKDPDMPAKLLAESGAIMRWLVEGHAKWRETGSLRRCAAVKAATDDYLAKQATLDMWIEERCEVVPDDERPGNQWPKAGDLYRDFKQWKEDRGEVPLAQGRWGEQMGARFTSKTSNGIRYIGIVLRSLWGPR